MLTDADRQALLSLARATLEAFLAKRPLPEPELSSPALREPRGVFVTLTRDGSLRGCIGRIEATRPLAEGVREMAAHAARDPRLDPVTADELPRLRIEISVLTPLRRIVGPADVRIGEHGLVVRGRGASGLLLPQVATEYGWDAVTFLRQTCRKAGLPPEAWREEGVDLAVFGAEVFGEDAGGAGTGKPESR